MLLRFDIILGYPWQRTVLESEMMIFYIRLCKAIIIVYEHAKKT